MTGVVVIFLLLLAVALLAVAVSVGVVVLTRSKRNDGDLDATPGDVLGLRQEVAALRAEVRGALRHVGLVRYDAFAGAGSAAGPSTGGRLSWSLALLDDDGNGVVLTGIHGRSEARSYAKTIRAWDCEQPMSPEEAEAVAAARPAGFGRSR